MLEPGRHAGRVEWRLPILAVAVILGGCGSSPGEGDHNGAQRMLAVELAVRIDGYEADLVPPTTWMGISPRGRLAVVQRDDHAVRFFDRSGAEAGSFGGDGEGPSEFRRPIRGGWIGDTLWISDTQLNRVTLIGPDLELVRTFLSPGSVLPPASARDSAPTYSSATPYAVYRDDEMLLIALFSVGEPARPAEAGYPLLAASPDAHYQREVAAVLRDPSVAPLPARRAWTIAPDGSRLAFIATEDDAEGGQRLRVTVVSAPAGDTLVDRTMTFDPIAFPAAVADSLIESRVSATAPAARARTEERLRSAVPATYPAGDRVMIGSDDRIWIRRPPLDSGRPWLVLNAEGDALAEVIVPASIRLFCADATRVWGVERDELDVESIVGYRLIDGEQ